MGLKATDAEIEASRRKGMARHFEDTKRTARAAGTECAPNDVIASEAKSFGLHEALDRAYLAEDFVERHLLRHPAVIANAEWYATAYKAHEKLWNLYQDIGTAHLKDAP